jgi:hypothetical protein
MNTQELKDRVRRRHPATQAMGSRTIPGPWTVIEETFGCDLIAFSAVANPAQANQRMVRFPIIGYELKVSRSDFRGELLRPYKRKAAISRVHEFYIAAPKGLLTREELAYREPVWEPGDFQRTPCDNRCRDMTYSFSSAELMRLRRWRKSTTVVEVPYTSDGPVSRESDPLWYIHERGYDYELCPRCRGRGWLHRSRVEREAPTLWIPRDVGFVEVDGRGCRVVRRAPVNLHPVVPQLEELGDLVRFVSSHPDPRHDGVVERDRAHYREIREHDRQVRRMVRGL